MQSGTNPTWSVPLRSGGDGGLAVRANAPDLAGGDAGLATGDGELDGVARLERRAGRRVEAEREAVLAVRGPDEAGSAAGIVVADSTLRHALGHVVV